jgi:phosphonate transport system ATP-binding protein
LALSKNKEVVLDAVVKRFGATVAVNGFSIVVGQGETVALVGPSGSGKTTLLRMLAGSIAPDAGLVSLQGKEPTKLKPGGELAGLVGIVAQQYDLVPNLSALQNVLAGRLGAWGFWRSLWSLISPRDRGLAMQALERVGISDRAGQRAGRLSGGEQQRVALARVLVQDPSVLLADEPVSSLDPARAADVLDLLIGIVQERGKTLIASMHAVDLARERFDRLVGVRNGAVLFDAAPGELPKAAFADLYALEGLRDV